MSFGKLSCRCSGCRRERNVELTRRENGGKLLPLASETRDAKVYTAETREPCRCGNRRVVVRLDLRA